MDFFLGELKILRQSKYRRDARNRVALGCEPTTRAAEEYNGQPTQTNTRKAPPPPT